MMDNVVLAHPGTGEMLPVFDTWTVLPALAEATERIRMGPLVSPCRRRHPALMAKITTTFDRISNGRLDLGLGPGDDPIYWEPWGMGYPKASTRIEVLREEIAVMKKMWTEDEADFEGKHYTLVKATNDPKPVQKPHPPIWIGLVLGRKLMPRLAAEVADGINVYNASDRAAKDLLDIARERCDVLGRDFDAISKSRSVNVILQGRESGPEAVAKGAQADGSLAHVIGTAEELARERQCSLDEQHQRIKASTDKKSDYSRITERHVIGTVDQVVDDLCQIAEAGFDHLIIHGLDSIGELRRFWEEVVPRVDA
jgi:alkanesulfonate monooxygenase SsuD/methylene tetrahydromethanopterin reductase-like flavin-dependent oxidoreductase (luciferase family)